MSTHATGTLEVQTWDEKTWEGKLWNEVPGAKLTHAITIKAYHGDIEGDGTSHSLTNYSDDGSAIYIGMERIVGRVGSRSGSFVLQSTGTYDPNTGTAEATLSIVSGSGTGELNRLRGTGAFVSRHGASQTPYTLDYDFE